MLSSVYCKAVLPHNLTYTKIYLLFLLFWGFLNFFFKK